MFTVDIYVRPALRSRVTPINEMSTVDNYLRTTLRSTVTPVNEISTLPSDLAAGILLITLTLFLKFHMYQ